MNKNNNMDYYRPDENIEDDFEEEENATNGGSVIIAEEVLTEDQIAKCFEIFEELKKENDKLETKLVGKALRKMGFTPLQREVKKLIELEDPFNHGFIEKEQLLQLVARQSLIPSITIDQVITSLRYLQYKNPDGLIETARLFEDLIILGEPLEIKDAGRLIAVGDPDHKGQFDVDIFFESLMGAKKPNDTKKRVKTKKTKKRK